MIARILFLCSDNACRSQMAEAFARAVAPDGVEVYSAGIDAADIDPMTVKVMGEEDMDLGDSRSKRTTDLGFNECDVIVTLCDRAAELCPALPGNPTVVNWSLPDPRTFSGSDDKILASFRELRDEIKVRVEAFFNHGYVLAFIDSKMRERLILDHISDGILAHDMHRTIFFFNSAAERITGFSREEVMGKDCHEVFPGSLCGGKCLFCEGEPTDVDFVRRELELVQKRGEKRIVDMTVRVMMDCQEHRRGMLVTFKDLTRERRLARRVGEVESFSGIIGKDKKMLEIFDMISDLAESNAPVLVHGESGTGKELVAAAIHNEGPRANKLFVPVNCGALPESLLESELFGHVKGAFTGAVRDKKGRFELADGGTIFLDEIGDISPAMQVKLLRVLQEGHFERVGSEKTVRVDVRIISATNRDLAVEIAEGRFREDLYYRLNVVPVLLPPLRERRNDIPLLVSHMLERFLKEAGKSGITIEPDAMDVMLTYDWPGNIRELQNWIQFALVKCRKDNITVAHLPPTASGLSRPEMKRSRRKKLDLPSVRAAIDEAGGNKVEAAKLLGVSRATLYRFLDDAGGA